MGAENRLVPVAIEAILKARNPGYGPVVLYGPSGTGKSHLAMGLVGVYRTRWRQRPAVYVPAVDFGRELADAIETQSMDEFQERYRRASLLAIDDVDRLAGREASQRELTYTLDAVLEAPAAKWCLPARWPRATDRLPSEPAARMMGGLTVPLAVPGAETRLAILKRLAEERRIELGEREAKTLAVGLEWPVPRLAGA